MKVGKLPYNALKRSVLRPIHTRRKEILSGAGIGRDSAVFAAAKTDCPMAASVNTAVIETKWTPICLLYRIANDLAASGAEIFGIEISLTIPETVLEQELAGWMKELEASCGKLNVEIMGGHTLISKAVAKPLLSLTGFGAQTYFTAKKPEAGMELIMTKQIALEGTALLAMEKEKELSKRYTYEFIMQAKQMKKKLLSGKEVKLAAKEGVFAMHNLSEGGILGGLWEMADGADLGLEISLPDIPICQETVEIGEFFGVNPYQLMSGGAMLMAAFNGHRVAGRLLEAGIDAAVIGRFTDKKERIIRHGQEVRYLERPASDEIYKIFEQSFA